MTETKQDLAELLRRVIDSGFIQAICRGEETTACAHGQDHLGNDTGADRPDLNGTDNTPKGDK